MTTTTPTVELAADGAATSQVDDKVQNSALGAVKPMVESAVSGRLVPVSAATPDAEPKAERKLPPQVTGHGIAPQYTDDKPEQAYADLPKGDLSVKPHAQVVDENATAASAEDAKQVEDPKSPLEVVPEVSDPPFPRATPGLPPLTPTSV